MKRIERLKKEAKEAAKFRGHRMKRFRTYNKEDVCAAFCRVCGKQAWVHLTPMPNGIEIHGEAVALGCV